MGGLPLFYREWKITLSNFTYIPDFAGVVYTHVIYPKMNETPHLPSSLSHWALFSSFAISLMRWRTPSLAIKNTCTDSASMGITA